MRKGKKVEKYESDDALAKAMGGAGRYRNKTKRLISRKFRGKIEPVEKGF
jgi:endonuclease III-like uncharacterized protein